MDPNVSEPDSNAPAAGFSGTFQPFQPVFNRPKPNNAAMAKGIDRDSARMYAVLAGLAPGQDGVWYKKNVNGAACTWENGTLYLGASLIDEARPLMAQAHTILTKDASQLTPEELRASIIFHTDGTHEPLHASKITQTDAIPVFTDELQAHLAKEVPTLQRMELALPGRPETSPGQPETTTVLYNTSGKELEIYAAIDNNSGLCYYPPGKIANTRHC